MSNITIAIAGNKGVGKDTAALNLIEEFNFGRVSFADALKDATAKACEMPMSLFYDPAQKDFRRDTPYILNSGCVDRFLKELPDYIYNSLSPAQIDKIYAACSGKEIYTAREAAQFFGTEIGRNLISPTIWLDIAKEKVNGWHKRGINAIITDARFENERKMVRDLGGINVLLKRKGCNGDSHISENSLGVAAEYDYVIYNNDSINLLNRAFENIINDIVLENNI